MQYLRGWRALMADPEWKGKVGVATVLILSTIFIPVLGQLALAGWMTLVLRRAALGQDTPLPPLPFNLGYLKELLTLGFKPFLAQLLYSIPFILMAMLFGCFGGIINVIAARGDGGPWLAIVFAVFMLLYLTVTLLTVPLMTVASMRASLTDDLKAAIGFKPVVAMTKAMFKDILVGGFVMALITTPIMMLGMIACYVGIFPAAVIITVMQVYFHAELYRRYLEKGGQPLPIGAVDVGAAALATG
ncbi:MAG: DUF4013 domain-containing protein [Sandaracinaceae bacterium]|nr:DUF4013 domain-containing protein [Sandaracinaceae bacterium]